MKKLLKWLAVPALAATILVGSATGALASNDVWHRGQADYYYGTGDTVDVELSMHTWVDSFQNTHVEGNMFVNTVTANDVKAIDIINIKLWRCDSGATNCVLKETWPNNPGTFCLDTCGNPDYRKDTDDLVLGDCAPGTKEFHVEAIYQLQWSTGNWSTNKDENSHVWTWCP